MALTTRDVFFDVCRALFGKDKLLLAFMIAVALHTYEMIETGLIRPAVLSTSGSGTAVNAALPELHLLLHGPSAGKVTTALGAGVPPQTPAPDAIREVEEGDGDMSARSSPPTARTNVAGPTLEISSSGRMLLAQASSLVPTMRGFLDHLLVRSLPC